MAHVAVVGAGFWGKNVVKTLASLNVLGAVAESSNSIRESLFNEKLGKIRIIENYKDFLDDPSVSAIAIATPVSTHYSIAKECLCAGKDVFVEKPMALSVKEAEDLVNTAEKHKNILMTGHLLMYKPAIEFIKYYLDEGHLGQVYSLHQERAKLGKARVVENALWSLGVHDVAALIYLCGEGPNKTFCVGHRTPMAIVEDDTYLHMSFSQGKVAHLHNSWLWPEDRRCLTIIGEKAMLIYDEKRETVTLSRKTIDSKLENVDLGSEVIFQGDCKAEPLKIELEHFLHCIKTRERPRSCGRNGLDVVKVLESAKPL